MSVERIQHEIERLRTGALEKEGMKLNMLSFISEDGTECCLAGSIVLRNHPKTQGRDLSPAERVEALKGVYKTAFARNWLELTKNQAAWLFFPTARGVRKEAMDANYAINALEQLLKHELGQ